jgi:hypothetical protein
MGFESVGDQVGAGFFVAPNLIMTAWSFLARQARGIRVLVTLPTFVISVDGVLVEAVPTLGIAFVHVNPALFKCTGFAPVPLPIALDPAAGQTVFVYPLPSHTGFATGTIAQASFGTQGYTTSILVSGIETALYGSAVIRASDYAIVGMVQNTVAGTDVMAAVHGALLQWAMSRYGVYNIATTTVLPGFGAPPLLKDGLALGQAVVGYIQTGLLPAEVTVYAPMVTTAVNPAYTTYFLPGTQYQSDMLTLGAPATGAWVTTPDLLNTRVVRKTGLAPPEADISSDASNAVALTTSTAMAVEAAGIGYARLASKTLAAFSNKWVTTTTPVSTGTTDVSSVAVGTRVHAFSAAPTFAVSSTTGSPSTLNTLPYMLVYADLGLIVFTAGLTTSEVPLASSMVKEIEAPGGLQRVPYIAPFATVDLKDADVTYTIAGSVYTVTWSSTDAMGVPVVTLPDTAQFLFQVQYDAATAEVLVLYRTMPNVWATTEWIAGTTLTSEFDPLVSTTVTTTQLVALDTQPQTLDIVAFGVAGPRSNLLFVQSTDPSAKIGQGAVAPTRLPDGSVPPTATGSLVAVLQDATTTSTFFALLTADWRAFDEPLRVTAVDGVPVGQAGLNALSLPLTLVQVAPLSSSALPTTVAVSVADVSFLGAPVYMGNPGTLWTTIRAGLGMPPVVTSGSSANTVVVSFPDVFAYSAQAFMLPANDTTDVEADIVAITVSVRVPLGTTPSEGSTVLVQLAATDSSGIRTRSFADPSDPTCAVLRYGGASWSLYTCAGYGGATSVPTLYIPGTPFTLTYTRGDTVPQRVNTVLIGLPPTPQTPMLPASDALLGSVAIQVDSVQTQVLGAYSAASSVAYAVTFDAAGM